MLSRFLPYILGLVVLVGVIPTSEGDAAKDTKKYKERVEKFKQSVLGSLSGAASAVEDLKDDAISNYDKMLKSFVDGQKNLAEQFENGNKKLLENYGKNYENLKENIKKNYNNYIKQGRENFDGNVSKFKKYCEDVIDKVEGMGSYCQESLDSLQDDGKKKLIGLKQLYTEAMEHFEKGHKEAIKKSGVKSADKVEAANDEALAF